MLNLLTNLGVSKLLLIASGVVVVTGVSAFGVARSPKPAADSIVRVQTTAVSVVPSSSTIATASSTSTVKPLPSVTNSAITSKIVVATSPPSVAKENDHTPPLLLKGVGINFDYYDPATGRAGDVVFTKDKLQFNVLLTEYGFTIPADQTSSGQSKRNPQPTWQVPMGTKVRSIVDGVVTNVSTLYSNDYSIMVATDPKSNWQYETEHVINPLVKVGDRVTAGQVIAEVSPHNKDGNAGYGLVEIGILKGGTPPQHVCPFAYLDPSIKDDFQNKLRAFYKSWEEYRGDTNLYDEASQAIPGCLTQEAIDG